MIDVEMRWRKTDLRPHERILQWRVIESDSDGSSWVIREWTTVPVEDEK